MRVDLATRANRPMHRLASSSSAPRNVETRFLRFARVIRMTWQLLEWLPSVLREVLERIPDAWQNVDPAPVAATFVGEEL
jgi:hypothetical protein